MKIVREFENYTENTPKVLSLGMFDGVHFGHISIINLLKSVELKWLAAEIGFDKIVMKNGIFLGYFPDNPQDKFYQSEKFRNIIAYLSQNPREAQLKEKSGKEGNQLMMRKDGVKNVDEVNVLLTKILS